MDNKYVTLFKNLAQSTAASAEAVMEYDRETGDEEGLRTATSMRDDFQDLTDRIASNMDNYQLSKDDARKLLICSMIQVNQLADRIANLKKAMTSYQTDLIPKLQKVVDAETDEEAVELANTNFIIDDNE